MYQETEKNKPVPDNESVFAYFVRKSKEAAERREKVEQQEEGDDDF